MFQITQFVLDLGKIFYPVSRCCPSTDASSTAGFIYFACYTYFANTYAPSLPHRGTCGQKKQELAAVTGCMILSSYLVLFIMFYLSTYKKPSSKKALQKAKKTEVPTMAETTGMATDALKSATSAIVETVHDDKCLRG
jgi:hypothetical protein